MVKGMLRRPNLLLLLLLSAATLAACSRPDVLPPGAAAAAGSAEVASAAPGADPTPRPAVSIPAEMQGTWQASVTGTSASSGTWLMRVTPDNVLLRNPGAAPDDFFEIWPISLTPTTITFEASPDCPDQASVTEGRYGWSLRGDQLQFTLVDDSCGDRAATLTTSPWTKAP